LAHVYALEVGLINPFIDEGMACALGSPSLVTTAAEKKDIANLINDGYQRFLDGVQFRKAHTVDRQNVYGLAQLTVRHWLKTYGISRLLGLLREATTSDAPIDYLVIKHLEPYSATNSAILRFLDRPSRRAR
jgi:hypothetical protein